ncbi:hypothetical protein [Bacteroides helcogenes]|uniref:hypothetical protein n=1 Tax=Bacteroides helcogenes TaxID=290053 RepID=UPI00030D936E|nr:hypothetical protein [Bacteroides helcogenes]MDY5239005.1 hypothetical protein [Bacteroides helcogenes]
MEQYFQYGEKETAYLKGRDKRLADVIENHRKITRALFEKYRRRYSPHGSVACIYLWAVSAGAVEGLKDYVPKQRNDGRNRKNTSNSQP